MEPADEHVAAQRALYVRVRQGHYTPEGFVQAVGQLSREHDGRDAGHLRNLLSMCPRPNLIVGSVSPVSPDRQMQEAPEPFLPKGSEVVRFLQRRGGVNRMTSAATGRRKIEKNGGCAVPPFSASPTTKLRLPVGFVFEVRADHIIALPSEVPGGFQFITQ